MRQLLQLIAGVRVAEPADHGDAILLPEAIEHDASTAVATVATTPFAEGTSAFTAAFAVALGLLALVTVLGRLEQRSSGQVHPPLAIDLGDEHLDLVADVHHIFDGGDTVVRKLRD